MLLLFAWRKLDHQYPLYTPAQEERRVNPKVKVTSVFQTLCMARASEKVVTILFPDNAWLGRGEVILLEGRTVEWVLEENLQSLP